MENPHGNSPTDVNKAPTIQFRTQDIGVSKVSQTDFFKKHRQEYAVRQKRTQKIRRRVLICVSILFLATVAISILIIIFHRQTAPAIVDDQVPPEMQIWNGEAQRIQSAAQEIYETDQDVSEYFDQQIDRASIDAEKVNLVLVEMQFYSDNFQPEAVITASAKINVEQLTVSQVGIYGGLLMNAYINIGDNAMAEYYLNLMEEKNAIGGGEG